jgi:uncharacterized protein YdeI (YjbR/CyaY-like superfamily)
MDHDKFEQVEVTSQDDLWTWLDQHHDSPESVWLVTWKAAHPDHYVSREAVLDALVAFGWIDGRRLKLDDARTMQLISPRKQQAWAKTYKDRATRLTSEGRMHPAGLAAIAQAQQSGRWTESDPVDALLDPDDLVEALCTHGATGWWQASAPSYRRNILRWIAAAKRPETRQARIAKVATLAAQGQKVPQY